MFLSLLFLSFVAAGGVAGSPIHHVSIQNATVLGGSPFALNGYTDYSVATIADIRFPGCTTAPCQVSSGQNVDLQIDFRPRDFHCCFSQRGILLQDTTLHVLSEGDLPSNGYQPGQLYTLNYPFTVNAPFRGASELRLKVFQNYVHEIHVVIPINIA